MPKKTHVIFSWSCNVLSPQHLLQLFFSENGRKSAAVFLHLFSHLEISGGDGVIACHVHAAGMQLPSDFVGPGDEEPRAAVVGEAEGTAAAQHFTGPRGGAGGKGKEG